MFKKFGWSVTKPANTELVGLNRHNIPISKHCNDVRIDSAVRVLLQSRFYTRHMLSQHEVWLDQIQWKFYGPSPLQAVYANTDNRIKFRLRFMWIKYNVGPKTIII